MRWLILVHRIPARPLYLRAKMRQRLAAAGAVAVKNSVYLLPAGAEALEDLQWIAQEIVAGGGDAHLFEGDFVDAAASELAIAQFRAARDEDYRTLAEEAAAALKRARSAASRAALATEFAALAKRLDDIRAIDFFEAPARSEAERALAAIEKRLARDEKEETRMLKVHADLRGKVWVTRPGVKVDRMASAWFIRRFIDPKARFRFVDPSTARRDGEVRFDMVGGDFTHEKDRCTLETLVHRVGLPDKGVRAIAEIIHDLDLKDGKFGHPEAPGIRALLDGLMNRCPSDEERIERSLLLFDDLHESLGRRSGRKGRA